MRREIEFFASFTSPYCYFAIDRLGVLAAEFDSTVLLRPVRPGILRLPGSFASRTGLEQAYFVTDVEQTARFLQIAFAFPDPYPIATRPDTYYVAADAQPYLWRPYNLLGGAPADRSFALYTALMRCIWSGATARWFEDGALEQAMVEAGLSRAAVSLPPSELEPRVARQLDDNEARFTAAGHWGVPTFSFAGEPFYGQDRLDQLRWRLASACSEST